MLKGMLVIITMIVALICIGGTADITLSSGPRQQGGTEERKELEQPAANTSAKGVVQPEQPSATEAIDTSDWRTYRNNEYGFEIKYPGNAKKTVQHTNEVRIDLPFGAGTLLLRKYLLIAIEETPPGEGVVNPFHSPITKAEIIYVNDVEFRKETGIEGAAGSIYDFTNYSTKRGTVFICLSCVLCSASPGVFDVPPPPFSRDEEATLFEQILSTFRFVG